ncbi:hypothetical protein Droror1_Dr00024873 [Drosera rotundifolia]
MPHIVLANSYSYCGFLEQKWSSGCELHFDFDLVGTWNNFTYDKLFGRGRGWHGSYASTPLKLLKTHVFVSCDFCTNFWFLSAVIFGSSHISFSCNVSLY